MLNSNRVGFILQTDSGSEINIDEVVEKSSYLQEMINNAFGFTVTIAVRLKVLQYSNCPPKTQGMPVFS